jgi:hypothetical protein
MLLTLFATAQASADGDAGRGKMLFTRHRQRRQLDYRIERADGRAAEAAAAAVPAVAR